MKNPLKQLIKWFYPIRPVQPLNPETMTVEEIASYRHAKRNYNLGAYEKH